MKRHIIRIDADKCTGCGECIPDCPEGALQMIDGKARLVSDLFCDGLGACVGTCPAGAISVEEREAEPYSERRVMENIAAQGPGVIAAHLRHLKAHGEDGYLSEAVNYLNEKKIPVPEFGEHHVHSCPGSMPQDFRGAVDDPARPMTEFRSELRQWPVQLKLLNPAAPYFDDADLLLAADCVPFAFGGFHPRFLAGKTVIMFCPKLDPCIDEYVDKLAAILSLHNIRSITVVRMEVPCCGGINAVLKRALEKSKKQISVTEHIISIKGEVA